MAKRSAVAKRGEHHAGSTGAAFDMYGISGLQRYGAVSRVYEEFLRELQGPAGMKSYREMWDNSPVVGAIMFAANHLCRKVSYRFRPANSSTEAKAVADFVGGAIFDDMESTWQDTISEILTMIPFGWAMMEFSFKRRLGMSPPRLAPSSEFASRSVEGQGTVVPRFASSRFEDGKIGFRSWSLRAQETLFMWEFDEDSNATVMQQMAPPDYKIRRVPMAKSLLFRTQVSKNNPEGRSALRNAWVPYYMIKNLQVFEGIGIERDLAGYPMIQIKEPDPARGLIPPDIWNTKDPAMVSLLAVLKTIVRSVRHDEQQGLVMPWWADFSLVSTGSRRRMETDTIIKRYEQRIAMSMMADFIMLGHEAVGSKALASTKISLFTSALSSFLDVAGAIIDRQAVPVLLQFNGIPQELTPSFEHGDVESINLEELGSFLKNVIGTGFNPLSGVDARKRVMQAAKLPIEGMDTGKITMAVGATGDSQSGEDNGPPVNAEVATTGQPGQIDIT